MTNIDKYGEFVDDKCRGCGKDIKPDWVACPYCGAKLKSQPDAAPGNRFICPGCGEKSSAQDSYFCQNCGAFVHSTCLKNINNEFIRKERIKSINVDKYRHHYACPICETVLKTETDYNKTGSTGINSSV